MAGEKDRPEDADLEQKTPPSAREGEEQESASGAAPDQAEGGETSALAKSEGVDQVAEASEDEQVATQLGVQKYVHASFFAVGILAAYLLGKLLQSAWNSLADWPEAVRRFPFLLEYTEDERGSTTLVIGAVLGVALILRYYRRPSVRSWATDVAGELARVTWPTREIVTNGTIVVLVAGAVATFYVAVLDRLWSYLTNLIYG